MKKIIYILSIVLLFLTSIKAQDQQTGQMEVMMKMLSLKNALVSKDSVVLSKVLADDVTYGHTNSLIQTKVEIIRSVMSGEQDYKTIEPSNMKVRLFGSTAIVNMDSKVVMMYKNQPLDLKMKITFVWIKHNNEWQLEARQAVKIID